MQSDHTAKAFDEDLQELNRLICEMGGLAERQIAQSVDALVRRDDNFPSAARGLGARSMMQSAVHGSSSEGSISTR
jgi:phosphate uptake regulator